MRTIEATGALEPMLSQLQTGEPVEIRRGNQPVAVVYPATASHADLQRIQDAIEGLQRIQSRNTLGGISLKSLIDEGRP